MTNGMVFFLLHPKRYRKDTFLQLRIRSKSLLREQFKLRGLDSAVQLVFGIDLGPRPGIAWLADGIVVGSAQLEQIEFVADHITGLAQRLSIRECA